MAAYLTDAELAQAKDLLNRIAVIYQAKVVGQEDLRRALTACLLADGHVLVESVPGLAKTTAAQTLASAVSGSFHRIQCTPDLMPNDIVGSQIWNQASGEMVTQLGPVHANLVLLDEINRSSAKTQSAMLEAMQEGQTTIGGVNHRLPRPFMVMATQNPIEEEGTYVLPEAQMDRFLLKEVITYPTPVDELEVLERIDSGAMSAPVAASPISVEDVLVLQDLSRRVYVHNTLKAYIVDIINTTRCPGGPSTCAWAPRREAASRSCRSPRPWRSWTGATTWSRTTSRNCATRSCATASSAPSTRWPTTSRSRA